MLVVYKSSEFQKTLRQSLSIVLLQVCRYSWCDKGVCDDVDDNGDDDDDDLCSFLHSFTLINSTYSAKFTPLSPMK